MDEFQTAASGGRTPFHPSSEFRGKEGKVVYCAECRRMALGFGGLRVVFHRRGSESLIAHMRNFLSLPELGSDPESVALGMGEEEDLLLLNRAQAKEAAELIEMAAALMDAEWPGGRDG